METSFDKLLKQYNAVYNRTVYGKGNWREKCSAFIIASAIPFLFLSIWADFANRKDLFMFSLAAIGILDAFYIAAIFSIMDRTDMYVSDWFFWHWVGADPGCKIEKTNVRYEVSLRELSAEQNTEGERTDQAKIGRIKLLPQNAAPLLVSLRGQNGPVGKTMLAQDFLLTDDPDTVSAQETVMPHIDNKQFGAFPETVTVPQLRVELFPGWTDDENSERWIFTVANPDAQDELKKALDLLNKTIRSSLIAGSIEKAVRKKRPFKRKSVRSECCFDYTKQDLIRILNGEDTDTPYAEEIGKQIEKIEAIAASARPLIGADMIPKIETTVPA